MGFTASRCVKNGRKRYGRMIFCAQQLIGNIVVEFYSDNYEINRCFFQILKSCHTLFIPFGRRVFSLETNINLWISTCFSTCTCTCPSTYRWLPICLQMWFYCNPLPVLNYSLLSRVLPCIYQQNIRWELGHVVCNFDVEDYQIMIGILKIWFSFTSLDLTSLDHYT